VTEATGGSLVGFYFHVFDADGQIVQQGHFVADLGQGFFMVEHFEGIADNTPLPGRLVVHIATVADDHWMLYETEEAMREAYRGAGGPGPAGAN
jgi:hypothetical protein